MNARNLSAMTVVVLFTICAGVKAEDPVYFADANLKAAVEEALGISDPTPTDMLGLTSFSAQDREIADLTGIEFATNLTELNVGQNQFSSISALSELTNLTTLYLSYNYQLNDISALQGLINLEALYLAQTQITGAWHRWLCTQYNC